jgi:hypothetical protein
MMKHVLLVFFAFLIFQNSVSQSNQLWKGYFSYFDIRDVSEGNNTIFAASQNALIKKNETSGDLKVINTIDGLSGEFITAVYHSKSINKTIIGYETGLISVRNDADGSVIKIVDIISKQIPTNVKKINHFMEYQGIIYVSCDFGIVQYNLNTLVFGDTYLIGDGGAQLKVNQSAVFEGNIYAATANGMRKASVTNPNLIDFNQWTTLNNTNWVGIETFGANLLAVNNIGNVQKIVASVFVNVNTLPQAPKDFRSSGDYLIATTQNHIYVYNSNLALLRDIVSTQVPETTDLKFSCATIVDSSIYFGTQENGLYKTTVSNSAVFENLSPDGPLRNNIFRLKKTPTSMWAVFGGYGFDYAPQNYQNGPTQYGISKLKENKWLNIPYSKVLGAKSLSSVTVDPDNENIVYVSSYFSGLLKLENDIPKNLFDETNTGPNGLQRRFGFLNLSATTFDKNKKLWMGTSIIENSPLNSLSSNGTWQKYDTQNKIPQSSENRYNDVLIDKNNTKWFVTFLGLIAFNEETNKLLLVKDISGSGSARVGDIRAAAIDTRNQIWLGTSNGLRVVQSVDEFINSEEVTSNNIIIEEDGLAQELFFELLIFDIAVDGANNKWIATDNSGVFQISPNGQKTLNHFTVLNSPLPSNTVNDIEIDNQTGEVFFATENGTISYKGTATSAEENLDNVYIYPNPVRPEYEGTVKISGLLDKATVKITDIGGNLVHEATSEGGTIEWDTKAFGKYKVASGVYMVFISANDGIETKTKKVMIVR